MGKASRERRLRRQRQLADQALLERVKQEFPGEIKLAPPGSIPLPPLSRQVTELITPELDAAASPEQEKMAVTLGVLAWNLSLMEDGLEDMDPKSVEVLKDPVLREVLQALITRKQGLFPDDLRMILDYQITGLGDGPRLSVVSANLNGAA
jgi:hypothetical protein